MHEMIRYAKISTKNLEEGMRGISVSCNKVSILIHVKITLLIR